MELKRGTVSVTARVRDRPGRVRLGCRTRRERRHHVRVRHALWTERNIYRNIYNVPIVNYNLVFLLLPSMPDPENSTRDSESVVDAEQGQGTDLSFIYNRIVLTPFCR